MEKDKLIKPKKPVSYQGVSLPVPFINDIRRHIQNNNSYRSVPEFVKAAIREKLEKDTVLNQGRGILYSIEGRGKEKRTAISVETLTDSERLLFTQYDEISKRLDKIDKKLKKV